MILAQADSSGLYKWAFDQGSMAVVLIAVGFFLWHFGSRLVNKWITTLDKTDLHLESSTKAMQDISASLGNLNDDISEMKPMIQDIHRHTQPKGPSTG